MSAARTFYITTPIYYVNDKPHIGHAYTTIACDVLARFKRLDGHDVRFLSGTDEHGEKVAKSAEAAGKGVQAFCDENAQKFRDLVKTLNASTDDFIRTTEPRHIAACQALWKTLEEKGQIYLGNYAGWYSVRDEAFYAEDETRMEGQQRVGPTGAPVAWVEEPSYFFRLSEWGDRLLAYYEKHPDFILPHTRRNEVASFVRQGLTDLSVSRTSFDWGVPVPGNPKHVMYVWIDALTNYITALGYPDTQAPLYRQFWPSAHHIIGKDILRFHAVYWPAFLMAAGLDVPARVFAHGWWTNEGQKISKSVGNVIDPLQLIETYGLDQTRYFVMREISFGGDGDFSRRAMVQRINSDLANDFGNLAQRILSMIAKNCGGVVPAPGPQTADDTTLLIAPLAALGDMRAAMDQQQIHVALARLFEVVAEANKYVDTQAPWALKKTDPARMESVLYTVAETVRRLAILAQPVMPESMGRMLDLVASPMAERSFAHVDGAFAIKPGTALPAPQGIFPRYIEKAPEPAA